MSAAKKALGELREEYVQNVYSIIDAANQQNIKIRAMGGVGFMIHCPGQKRLLQTLKRCPSDLDFMALGKQEKKIDGLFRELGYKEKGGQGITMEIWSDRRIFEHPDRAHVDVFFDELDFCHKIDLRKRLNLDSPTLSLADLILGKLQIVEINEKDLQDLIVVNMEHRLSEKDEEETINARYLAETLAQDWGFYHTAVLNLGKAKKLAMRYQVSLPGCEGLQAACDQIDQLLDRMESTPKTLKWKARSMIGTKVKWYRDPGEEYREVNAG